MTPAQQISSYLTMGMHHSTPEAHDAIMAIIDDYIAQREAILLLERINSGPHPLSVISSPIITQSPYA